jgi:hypothetical protein
MKKGRDGSSVQFGGASYPSILGMPKELSARSVISLTSCLR